jgi:molybdenum cofactor cytidylyltransferase
MNRAASWCGVILAAGESTRMGKDKALLPWPPTGTGGPEGTFLSGSINLLNRFTDLVVVVAGRNERDLASVVYACGGFVVRNPAPERGQFSSLQVGLQEVLNRGRDAAMVTLVDRPPCSAATIQTLLTAFEAAALEGKWAVVPEYGGKHGHPILLGREMIEAFLKAPAASTARDVEHHNQKRMAYVPVEDSTIAVNVNTPEDYISLRPQ